MAKTPQKTAKESVTDNQELADKNQKNGPKFAENRKKLQKKLGLHSDFVRMASWAVGIVGVYWMAQILWSLKGNILLKIPFDLAFGTATSPGIPVAMVQSLLSAFNPALAPLAPYLLVGGIAGLWLYQLSYHFFNEKLFAGNQKDNKSPTPESVPDQEEQEKTSKPKKGVQLTQETKKALASKEKAVEPKASQKTASKPVDDKKAAAKQGSGRPITSAFKNQQRQTRSMTKAQHEQAPKAAPKRKVTKK